MVWWISVVMSRGQSGRRRDHSRRPPTPPCVRFRTRRFMKHIEVFAVDPSVTQVQVDRRNAWGSIGSCEMPPSSTRDHVHSWQISKRDLYPNHTSSGSLPE